MWKPNGTVPRKVTDPTVDAVNVKNILKAFRFWIFVAILVYTIWFQIYGHNLYQAWKLRLKFPLVESASIFAVVIMAVGFVVSIYTRFLQWKKRPRFVGQYVGMSRRHEAWSCFRLYFQ